MLKIKSVKKIGLFLSAPLLSLNVMAQTNNDIADVATGSAKLTTLVAAVKAVGLVSALIRKGPITVFACTQFFLVRWIESM